jgi:hypothetical protein
MLKNGFFGLTLLVALPHSCLLDNLLPDYFVVGRWLLSGLLKITSQLASILHHDWLGALGQQVHRSGTQRSYPMTLVLQTLVLQHALLDVPRCLLVGPLNV